MSRTPLLFQPSMVDWFMRFGTAKTLGARLKMVPRLRPKFFKPVVALMKGLTDPLVNFLWDRLQKILPTVLRLIDRPWIFLL